VHARLCAVPDDPHPVRATSSDRGGGTSCSPSLHPVAFHHADRLWKDGSVSPTQDGSWAPDLNRAYGSFLFIDHARAEVGTDVLSGQF